MKPKSIVFSVLALLVTACGTPQIDVPNLEPFNLYQVRSAPQALRDVSDAIVLLHVSGGSGTGSWVSTDGLLITNNHVLGIDNCAMEGCHIKIHPQKQIGVPESEPEEVFAEPKYVLSDLDVTIHQIWTSSERTKKFESPKYLKIAKRSLKELRSQEIHVIGHPYGGLKKWSPGTTEGSIGKFFQASNAAFPGMSGSPVLDASGTMIGILHSIVNAPGNVTQKGMFQQMMGSPSEGFADLINQVQTPTRFYSVKAPHTKEEILENATLYRTAREKFAVDEESKPVDMVEFLTEKCDAALATTDFANREKMYEAMKPCHALFQRIDCDAGFVNNVSNFCPKQDTRDAWSTRIKNYSNNLKNFSSDFQSYLFMDSVLDVETKVRASNRNSFRSYLQEAGPDLNFEIAYWALGLGIVFDSVEGYGYGQIRDYVVNYEAVREYPNYASQIGLSWVVLYNNQSVTIEELRSTMNDLFEDETIPVQQKIILEDSCYSMGMF